jgi:hypothetical protein
VRIVFYISGHGFGHASRQVEVINALHERRPGLDVIIRSAVDPALLERTLRGPYQLWPGACDSGVVQTDSVSHDDEATIRAAIGFYRTLSSRADEEARALADSDVRLVVGDIPPLAFEVAARLSVPSVAIANFTWDWIYDAMPGLTGRAPDLVPMIRQAYARATLALELPMAGGLDVFPTRPAREARHARASDSRSIDRWRCFLSVATACRRSIYEPSTASTDGPSSPRIAPAPAAPVGRPRSCAFRSRNS